MAKQSEANQVDGFYRNIFVAFFLWKNEKKANAACNIHSLFRTFQANENSKRKKKQQRKYAYLLRNDIAINIYSIFICSFLFEQNGFQRRNKFILFAMTREIGTNILKTMLIPSNDKQNKNEIRKIEASASQIAS